MRILNRVVEWTNCMGISVIDERLSSSGRKYDYEEHGGASYTVLINGMDIRTHVNWITTSGFIVQPRELNQIKTLQRCTSTMK